jgi:hypothetical protein
MEKKVLNITLDSYMAKMSVGKDHSLWPTLATVLILSGSVCADLLKNT